MQSFHSHLSASQLSETASLGTGTSMPLLVPAGPGGRTLEKRSAWLGRALARRLETPSLSLHPLGWILGGSNPEAPSDPFRDSDLRCRSRLETLFARCEDADRLSASTSPPSVSVPWPSAVAALLDWAWNQTENWDSVVREACLLKPLMPLYLSSAMPAERRVEGQTIVETQLRKLALELIGLIELSRALESVGFSLWLNGRVMEGQDPRRLIQEGMSVDLSRIARAIEETLQGSGCRASKIELDAEAQSDVLDESCWSLAWQWSRHPEAFLVPRNVPVVAVPWTESLSHWKTTLELLKRSHAPLPKRCFEIRTMGDPFLNDQLEQVLDEIRTDQRVMTMVMIRYTGEAEVVSRIGHAPRELSWWQTDFLNRAGQSIEGFDPLGYVTNDGVLGLLYRDLDRSELAQWIREWLTTMRDFFALKGRSLGGQSAPWIVGIASVDSPTRSFRINRLLDAASRCLDNAASQGPGSIKSIEVF